MELISNLVQSSPPSISSSPSPPPDYISVDWQRVIMPKDFTSDTSPLSTHVDVLVVGAGPTGSMCACSLAKAELSVKVID
jgi:NADPH-dependent 2,4-dienoyl-CoA reductase/sulfur reductase-like enzyme